MLQVICSLVTGCAMLLSHIFDVQHNSCLRHNKLSWDSIAGLGLPKWGALTAATSPTALEQAAMFQIRQSLRRGPADLLQYHSTCSVEVRAVKLRQLCCWLCAAAGQSRLPGEPQTAPAAAAAVQELDSPDRCLPSVCRHAMQTCLCLHTI